MTIDVQTSQLVLAPKTVPPFTALVSSLRTTLNRLHEGRPLVKAVYEEATRLGLTINGPSQWHYIGASGDDNQEFQLDVVLPVQKAGDLPASSFSYKDLSAFSCVSYEHTGAWSDLPVVYDQLFEQFYKDGYSEGTVVREVHTVVDLDNPQQCVTEVQIETV